MAVSSIVLRISGNVALSDNSVKTFLGLYDGNVVSILVDDEESFRVNYPSKKSEIVALDPYSAVKFPTKGKIVPASDPVDSGNVVSSLAMLITGRVAYDDNSYQDFAYEVSGDGTVTNHVTYGGEGNEAWEEAFGVDALGNTVAESILSSLYSSEADPISVSVTS